MDLTLYFLLYLWGFLVLLFWIAMFAIAAVMVVVAVTAIVCGISLSIRKLF